MIQDFIQINCKYCKGCKENTFRKLLLMLTGGKELPNSCLSCSKRIKISIAKSAKIMANKSKDEERKNMSRNRELRIIECEDTNVLEKSVKVALYENGVQIAPTENYEHLDSIINKTVKGTTEQIKNTHHQADKYFVYNPAEDKPKHIYNSYNEAFCDAEKIAKKYKDCEIFVLKIVSEIKRTSFVETRTLDNNGTETVTMDIPF